jgi:hypothetical protein
LRVVRRAERLALVQAAYFVATGLWPLIHLRSFERVTGRKREGWLVRTVAMFVVAIGATLGLGVIRRDVDEQMRALGILGALAPTLIETPEATSRRISPIYLLDAALESLLVLMWLRTPPSRLDEAPIVWEVGMRSDEREDVGGPLDARKIPIKDDLGDAGRDP